jgi:hypothetical protein|nr:MAG TPA: hypothetical protein [Bacteriophage sp.]
MNTTLETKVLNLEELTGDLARSLQLTNGVVGKLINGIHNQISNQLKEEMVTTGKEIEANVTTAVTNTISNKIDLTIKEKLDERGLSKVDADRLTRARYKRMRELLGDSKEDKYKLFIPFYQGCMRKGYLKKFDVMRYADIEPDKLPEALEYIQNFNIIDTSWCVEALHRTYQNNEFTNNKLVHAYERYFNITVA